MVYAAQTLARRAEYALGVVSPVFAGGGAQLALLARAFEAATAGTPGTVLVGGEAGGGKSRLVAEFAASVRGRALVLAGGCVEISAGGLPYAPFTAILRQLVRSRGAGEIAALVSPRLVYERGDGLPLFTEALVVHVGRAHARRTQAE